MIKSSREPQKRRESDSQKHTLLTPPPPRETHRLLQTSAWGQEEAVQDAETSHQAPHQQGLYQMEKPGSEAPHQGYEGQQRG